MQSIRFYPKWLEEFQKKEATNEFNSIVFSYNVWDDHLVNGKFRRIYDIFKEEAPTSRASIVCYFNFETGLRFADEYEEGEGEISIMKELFVRLMFPDVRNFKKDSQPFREMVLYFEEHKRGSSLVLAWLSALLRFGWSSGFLHGAYASDTGIVQDLLVEQDIKKGFSDIVVSSEEEDRLAKRGEALIIRHKSDPFAVAVFETPKLLTPSETGLGSSDMADRVALDTFTSWAQENDITRYRNRIIYLAEALSDLPPELRKGGRGFYHIKVEPDTLDIDVTIEGLSLMREKYPSKEGDLADDRLAFLARGMEFKVLRRILADASASGETMSADLLLDQKSKNLVEQTGGLVRLVRHGDHTYEMLGALDYVIDNLKMTVKSVREGRWDLISRGKLYMGPRGTGKSETVKVVAAQSGITVAEFGAMREKWVGQSERNMELGLQKIRDNSPIFVIQDEMDGLWGRRGGGADNTGVNERLRSMMLDFLGDETVQGVVWFGLTNRPDLLDAAMIRSGRFDDKWLFTLPSRENRFAVLKAIIHQLEIELPSMGGGKFLWEIANDELESLAGWMEYRIVAGEIHPVDPKKQKSKLTEAIIASKSSISLNGAEIKKILKSARVRAFADGRDFLTYDDVLEEIQATIPEYTYEDKEMEEMALGYINNVNNVPEHLRDEVRKYKARQLEGGDSRFSGGLSQSS